MQVERSRRSEEVEPSGETDEQRRDSGKRVSNAWVTYLGEGDSSEKSEVIPHGLLRLKWLRSKGGLSRRYVGMLSLQERLTSYQVVGRVMAYQA